MSKTTRLHRSLSWPQAYLRRGSEALASLLKTGTNDTFIMTKTVLEAAIPDRESLADLLAETAKPAKPKPAEAHA